MMQLQHTNRDQDVDPTALANILLGRVAHMFGEGFPIARRLAGECLRWRKVEDAQRRLRDDTDPQPFPPPPAGTYGRPEEHQLQALYGKYDMPDAIKQQLLRYTNNRVRPGQFVAAALANDLGAVYLLGTPEDIALLPQLLEAIRANVATGMCGSWPAVEGWVNRGALAGADQ